MTRSALLGLGAAALWMGCQSGLFNIRVEDTTTSTVPASTPLEQLLGDFGFGDWASMDITQQEELANQGVESGDIANVRLRELTLEAVSPEGGDLSFIQQIEIYVEGPDLPRQLLAWQDEFPVGEPFVELVIEDVDLTDYAVAESMTLSTDVTGSRPDQQTTVEAFYALRVGVTQQGCKSYQQQRREE